MAATNSEVGWGQHSRSICTLCELWLYLGAGKCTDTQYVHIGGCPV